MPKRLGRLGVCPRTAAKYGDAAGDGRARSESDEVAAAVLLPACAPALGGVPPTATTVDPARAWMLMRRLLGVIERGLGLGTAAAVASKFRSAAAALGESGGISVSRGRDPEVDGCTEPPKAETRTAAVEAPAADAAEGEGVAPG